VRKKYQNIFGDKLRQFGPSWFIRQGLRYFQIILSAWNRKALTGPVSVVLMPTYRCNHRCRMCDFPGRYCPEESEMSTVRIKNLLDELASLPSLGVSFYGGEPLLRPDIVELIRYAHSRKLLVHLTTNGLLLDEKLSGEIIAAGTDVVSISLDGASPASHDRQRGVSGAFEKAIAAINSLRQARRTLSAGTRVAVTTVLTTDNLREIDGIVKAAINAGADSHTIYEAQPLLNAANTFTERDLAALREANREIARLQAVYPDYIDNSRRYIRIADQIFQGKKARLKCFAPYTDLFIDPYGGLYPCNHLLGLGIPRGQYQPGRLKDFWYSEKYQKTRDQLSDCAACNYLCHRELSLIFNRLWPGRRPEFTYGRPLPSGIKPEPKVD